MHFLLKAVVLQFAFMAVAEELQPPEWWVVVLKEDASMSPADHAQWAYEIHMENTHTAVDHIFGLVGSLRSDGYDFMTWEDTMDIIRQHPDVSTSIFNPYCFIAKNETNALSDS